MPETTVHIAKETWDAAKWLLAAGLALFGYNLKTTKQKVDELQKTAVREEVFNNTIQSLRDEIRDSRKETIEHITQLVDILKK